MTTVLTPRVNASQETAERVLVALAGHIARTTTSPTRQQLAVLTGLAPASISKQIARLVTRGLVTHGYRRRLVVTEAGWNAVVGLAVQADHGEVR